MNQFSSETPKEMNGIFFQGQLANSDDPLSKFMCPVSLDKYLDSLPSFATVSKKCNAIKVKPRSMTSATLKTQTGGFVHISRSDVQEESYTSNEIDLEIPVTNPKPKEKTVSGKVILKSKKTIESFADYNLDFKRVSNFLHSWLPSMRELDEDLNYNPFLPFDIPRDLLDEAYRTGTLKKILPTGKSSYFSLLTQKPKNWGVFNSLLKKKTMRQASNAQRIMIEEQRRVFFLSDLYGRCTNHNTPKGVTNDYFSDLWLDELRDYQTELI
jgi:hypothetical protein